MIPFPLITHAIAACAAAAAAWMWQANSYGKQIADMQLNQSKATLRSMETATRQTLEMQDVKDKAIAKAAQRNTDLARTAAAVRVERDGLRDDLAAQRTALPDAACAAVREYASTITAVFGECAAEAGGLAEAAGGHASDTLMLLDTWPKVRR